MALCELNSELAQLQDKRDKLANRAKNELALSELILSGNNLLPAGIELLKIALGDKIASLAVAVSKAYIDIKNANEGISHADTVDAIRPEIVAMLSAIQADPSVAVKMQTLKIDKVDAKYALLDLGYLATADGKYTKDVINYLNGNKKASRRHDALVNQISEAATELNEIRGKVSKTLYDRKQKSYNELVDRYSGASMLEAMQSIPLLTDNSIFPEIFVLTQSDASKNAIGPIKGVKNHTFSSVAEMELQHNTLIGKGVKNGESGIKPVDANVYEMSPLAILFGHKPGAKSFQLPSYVKNIIKLNAVSHMDDIYKVLSYEVGSQEFNEAWGIEPNMISEEEMMNVIKLHVEGNIPQAVVLKSLGKAIYAGLPVKFAKNVDMELEQRAIIQLGLYAIRYMDAIGLVKINGPVNVNNGSKTHVPIQVNTGDEVVGGLVPAQSIMNFVAELQHIGAAEDRNAPRDVNEVHEVSQTIRNSFMETSETVRENLKQFENTEFRFNDHAKLLYDLYTNNGKAGKEAAYAMAGVLSVDTSKPVIDQMKEMSKINYGKMQVDAFIEAYRDFGLSGKPFKLPYDYTVSGRYMINSVLNPQESKITRYLVTTKDIDSTIGVDTDANGVKTLSAQDLEIFKLGVSQAFDLDPDKHSDLVALKDLEKVVSISRNGTVEFNGESPFKTIYDALVDGRLNGSDAVSEEIKNALMAVNRKGAGFHAIQAIMALKQLSDATKDGVTDPVKLSFSLESDAITSGMILTLMQIGTQKAMDLASKGGVYTKEALDKWEKLYKLYKGANGGIEALTQKDTNGKQIFKLTHGWLLDFSKDMTEKLKNIAFVEKIYDQLEPQTKAELVKAAGSKDLMEYVQGYLTRKADFKDFYNTVAAAANADMKKIRDIAQTEWMNINSEISKAKIGSKEFHALQFESSNKILEVALIDVINEVNRKLAKPSVMVYIYGAMMSSIKHKMVDAVVVPKIYDVIKKINDLYGGNLSYPQFLAFINSNDVVRDGFITASEQVVLKAIFKGANPQFKTLRGSTFIVDDNKLMKNIIISEEMKKKLSNATNETLGKAFETGFKQFGEIDDYRDSVKSAEVVRFTMFKYKLKQALDKIATRMDDGSWKISAKDISSAIIQLEKDGFGHSVNDINGGKQPLYKKDALEKAFKTMLHTNKYDPVYSAIEGKDFGPNTGASGVVTIHSIDGFIDAVSAKAFDLIRIYDGSVSGINKMNESLKAYNGVVLDTTSWNSYIQQVKDLVNQIGKLEENNEIQDMLDSIGDADRASLLNTIQKLMGYGDLQEMDVIDAVNRKAGIVKGRLDAAEKFRNNGETELSIMHSYLTDSADMQIGKMAYGEGNKLAPQAVDKLYELYGKILQVLAENDMQASGSDGKVQSFNYQHAENAKKIQDIMSDNNISKEEAQMILDAADEKTNEDC